MAYKKRIIISVTNDLVVDHRVHKVATILMKNNYKVLLIGTKNKKSQPISRDYSTKRFQMIFHKKFLFYAEYNIRLFFYLLFTSTDIFLANDTDTLMANFFASFIRRKKLVFDAHEMFPEVPEVINRKIVKNFWTKIKINPE